MKKVNKLLLIIIAICAISRIKAMESNTSCLPSCTIKIPENLREFFSYLSSFVNYFPVLTKININMGSRQGNLSWREQAGSIGISMGTSVMTSVASHVLSSGVMDYLNSRKKSDESKAKEMLMLQQVFVERMAKLRVGSDEYNDYKVKVGVLKGTFDDFAKKQEQELYDKITREPIGRRCINSIIGTGNNLAYLGALFLRSLQLEATHNNLEFIGKKLASSMHSGMENAKEKLQYVENRSQKSLVGTGNNLAHVGGLLCDSLQVQATKNNLSFLWEKLFNSGAHEIEGNIAAKENVDQPEENLAEAA